MEGEGGNTPDTFEEEYGLCAGELGEETRPLNEIIYAKLVAVPGT